MAINNVRSRHSQAAGPKVVVFDFGGVLVDWDPRYLYRKLLADDPDGIERFLHEIDFSGWNLEQDRGRPFAEGVAQLCQRFPAYRRLIEAYDQRWEESLAGAIEGTVEIARELKQAGYPLYGLSNWSAEKFALVREKYVFFSWFKQIVISGEEQLVKPEPAIYELLLRRAERAASECVFIDDSPANIATATSLGFHSIHFQSPVQLRAELVRSGILGERNER